MNLVEKGYRMDAPEGCPDEIYSIMQKCWNIEPRRRPSFEDINKLLSGISFV